MATTVKVTSKGREIMSGRMKGTSPAQAEPLNIAWGVGTAGTAAVTDVGPYQEDTTGGYARVAGASSQVTTTSTNDTYQVVGTITALAALTIAEALLADSTTIPAHTTLSTTISSNSTTTFVVASASGFPGSGNYCVQISTEVAQVTGGQGTTSWTVTRGFNGSTALSSISSGTTITGGNNPGSTAVTGGSDLVHATFTGLALNTNDSIQFTFQVQVVTS